jgi:outer membrane protein OmpA-like peptidoglycan-associated protein
MIWMRGIIATVCSRHLFVAMAGLMVLAGPAHAADCAKLVSDFNRAVDAGAEVDAQKLIDQISVNAECGRFQIPAQRRLAGLRLAAVQYLMARGRPHADYQRLLADAERPEVLWQASATLAEVLFGERRFVEAAMAFDRSIEIIKNETRTPAPPSKFEVEGLIDRSAQARLLAANVPGGSDRGGFVKTARDQRDGTLGGIYSRSVRGIVPRAIPVPITFDYAKTSFTSVGAEAAQELLTAIKEQQPDHITLVGHTDVRGGAETNMKLSVDRAEAVAKFLRDNGISASIDATGRGATEPIQLNDTSGLTQDDIYALNRRVEWRRE